MNTKLNARLLTSLVLAICPQMFGSLASTEAQVPTRGQFESKITITPSRSGTGSETVIFAQQPTTTAVPTNVSPVQAPPQFPGRVQGVVPPFQRRPVPAPSGDISVSTFGFRADTIDLGSTERVPRISLKEAPVRDVLTLIARVAGLNVLFDDSGNSTGGSTVGTATSGSKVSLDIENESAQDVFNSVLRLSNLDASRIGKTIFVAAKLPFNLKNIVARTYRLNQIGVGDASGFLVGLGAERTINRQRAIPGVTTATVGSAGVVVQNTTTESIPTLESLEARPNSILPLKGLQVSAEERTNSLTLIGPPSLIDFASAQLGRLDARKRQVLVNVRIVEVNLLGNQALGFSSSFGIGNSFFSFDNGAAVVNFGGTPATASATAGLTSPNVNGANPIITNPYASATTFLDINGLNAGNGVIIGGTSPGQRVIRDGFIVVDEPNGAAIFANGFGSVTSSPLTAGITNFTRATPNVTTVTSPTLTTAGSASTTVGTLGTATAALPSFFQYPSQFLSRLQAQIVSGNAKVLTDPNLTVQEGENATVSLTQDVLVGQRLVPPPANTNLPTVVEPRIEQAGLTLNINVSRVDDNGFINMAISPSVSAPSSTTALSDGNLITLLSRRTLNSGQIRLRDNQTLILSGVIQDTDRETTSKVPFLGDLPIIGSLFRSTNTSKTRNEVVIVVTPRILDDSDQSQFGYTYQAGPEVQKVLDSNGVSIAPNR
jgi:type IV pilus assembly protein PilQ